MYVHSGEFAKKELSKISCKPWPLIIYEVLERGGVSRGWQPPGVAPGVGTVPTGVVRAATPAANVLKLARPIESGSSSAPQGGVVLNARVWAVVSWLGWSGIGTKTLEGL